MEDLNIQNGTHISLVSCKESMRPDPQYKHKYKYILVYKVFSVKLKTPPPNLQYCIFRRYLDSLFDRQRIFMQEEYSAFSKNN